LIDWSLFHLLNGALQGHPFIADEIEDFVSFWAVPLFAGGTLLLRTSYRCRGLRLEGFPAS
jgi:hypothetical protein